MRIAQILNHKHPRWTAFKATDRDHSGHLVHGQTNSVKLLWKVNSLYQPKIRLADHARAVTHQMPLPPKQNQGISHELPYIHRARGRKGGVLDDSTEQFGEATRAGTTG